MAKFFTLLMCASGLFFIFFVPVTYAIDFQLLGGALMLQILPAFVLGLWTRWLHPRALLAGWATGVVASCAMAYASGFASNFTLHLFGISLTGFIAFYGLVANLCVTVAATAVLRGVGVSVGSDRTLAADYA